MKDIFIDSIIKYINNNEMISSGEGVIVGVSGGADSVALLRVLLQLKKSFEEKGEGLSLKVIHVNHMIRGDEADRDERFVIELCASADIPYKVYHEDIPLLAKKLHMTEEEAGRHFRYKVFENEAETLEKEIQKRVRIAVAHNKDDLAETVLYNMIRGSSLFGLSGIRPVRGRIIRPLLMTRRSEIEGFLKELEQSFITDSTNMLTEYSRNKIRLSVMPELNGINDRAVDHIVDVALDSLRLRDDISAEITDAGCILCEEGKSVIYISEFKGLGQIAQGECILKALENVCGRRKDISREHIEAVRRLIDLETGKSVDLIYRMRARRSYNEIIICKDEKTSGKSSYIEEASIEEAFMDGMDTFPGVLETEVLDYDEGLEISKKEYTKMIDYDKIKTALVLRTPKQDDYIVINGDGGRKKLSRFFSHSKIEQSERTGFPVVADGDEIVWVVGLRLSEAYKVTPDTKRVMVLRYIKR